MGLRADSDLCFYLGLWTAEICTVLLESVLEQEVVAVFSVENMFTKTLPHHAQSLARHVTTLFPHRLSFAMATILTMSVRPFQRTHLIFTQRVKGHHTGDIDFAPTCGSEPGVGGVRTAMVGSDRTGRVLDAALGARTNLLMYAVLARTRQSVLKKKWMTSA